MGVKTASNSYTLVCCEQCGKPKATQPYVIPSREEACVCEPEIYPCRCGQVHVGPYAIYDYAHHNCFHSSGLNWLFGPDDTDDRSVWQLICGDCGNVFNVGPKQESN